MSRTDRKNHIRNGIHRFYRKTSKLNLCVQNTKVLDITRVTAELKQLSIQLEQLSSQPQTGELISKEEFRKSFNQNQKRNYCHGE